MKKRTIAQTPAPAKDIIKGSSINKKLSATKEGASTIELSERTIKVLQDKLKAFKEKHPNNTFVTLNDLKAVYRRGSGAYSTSHRPTITGGAPNSRNAWSFARVNKFLLKKGGTKVKAAYVQDDDLMAKGGILKSDSFKNWFKSSKVIDSKGNPKIMYHGTRYDFTEFKENIGKNTHHSSRHLGFFFTDYRVAQWFANPTWDDNEISMKDEYKKFRNKQLGVDKLNKELSMTSGFNYDKYEKLNSQIYNKETRIDNEWEKITYYRKRLDFGYGANVMPVYLSIQNPKEMSFNEVYSIGGGENDDYEKVEEKAKKLKQNLISKGYDGIKILPNDDNEEAEFEQYVAFYPNQIKSSIGNVGSFDPNNPDIRYKRGGATFNDTELLAKWKKGESIGFTGEAHLKAKGLIPRADGKKRKSEKYMEDGGEITSNLLKVGDKVRLRRLPIYYRRGDLGAQRETIKVIKQIIFVQEEDVDPLEYNGVSKQTKILARTKDNLSIEFFFKDDDLVGANSNNARYESVYEDGGLLKSLEIGAQNLN